MVPPVTRHQVRKNDSPRLTATLARTTTMALHCAQHSRWDPHSCAMVSTHISPLDTVLEYPDRPSQSFPFASAPFVSEYLTVLATMGCKCSTPAPQATEALCPCYRHRIGRSPTSHSGCIAYRRRRNKQGRCAHRRTSTC